MEAVSFEAGEETAHAPGRKTGATIEQGDATNDRGTQHGL